MSLDKQEAEDKFYYVYRFPTLRVTYIMENESDAHATQL